MFRTLASAVLLLATADTQAQDAGETVRGVITGVDLSGSPRRIVVRLDDGREIEPNLANRTRVTVKRGAWRYDVDPRVSDLQPGMTVQFKWDPRQVERILVLAVPPDARPGGGHDQPAPPSWGGAKPTPGYEAGRELTARVLDVSVVRGTLTAEVDGRSQVFLADTRDLRSLRKGERVVLLTGEDGRLVSVRPAKESTP